MTELASNFLTVEQCADMHPALSRSAIYKAIRKGRLRASRPGKRYLVARKELERWLRCPESVYPRASSGEKIEDNGSSETGHAGSGQDAAKRAMQRLLSSCKSTSPASAG